MPSDLPERPSPEEHEPEPEVRSGAGLRVAIYFLAVFLTIVFSQGLFVSAVLGPEEAQRLSEAAQADPTAAPDIDPVLQLWAQVLSAPLALVVTLFFIRVFDRRAAYEIGLLWPRGVGLQLFLAVLLAALPLGAWLVLSGPWVESRLEPLDASALAETAYLPPGAIGGLVLTLGFLASAFVHELIFRGYIYSTFRERFSWVHAAGLTNLLSVALFAGLPEVQAAGLINIFLLGLVAGALREKTGDLFLATTFAGTWNVLLGCALSLPISGQLYPRLFDHDLQGPEALTGGAFGPEGSWLLTGPLVVLVLGLAVWVESGLDDEEWMDDIDTDSSPS
ncbi:MAG: CPBP family intramembrane glutamic endopeptidase [Acidobacteriota bacterium]